MSSFSPVLEPHNCRMVDVDLIPRSALSMDLENPEVERIRKDFEMYRLNRDNEMANCQKKERKLETENKRLRAELLALQKTCTRMRAERDAALEAEQEALARASVFECDRDKVQRQFKVGFFFLSCCICVQI